jgi:hypothetical protein
MVRGVLQRFAQIIPAKPLCSDDPRTFGVRIRPRSLALDRRYLQINVPWLQRFLTFDVDREGAAFLPDELGLPTPTWSTTNPSSGHAHIVYELTFPIYTGSFRTGAGNPKSTNYMLAVKAALARALEADSGYVGLLTQNPLHPQWRTLAHDHAYTLEELARELPKNFVERQPRARRLEGGYRACFVHPLDQLVGRNVDCFNYCRKLAYRITGQCGSAAELEARVTALVHARNCGYASPMPEAEERSIARSITKFCWRSRTALAMRALEEKRRGILALPPNLELQARQRLGAEFTNESRATKTRSCIEQAISELGSGASRAAIARRASVSPSSVARYRRRSLASEDRGSSSGRTATGRPG